MSDATLPTIHDKAVIISTGDEIMTGQLQDSNACWLSAALIDAGIIPVEHCAVGDVLDDLVETIRRALRRAPLVIMTGGLGPTDGDLTREAICRATNDTLILDETLHAELAAKLARRARESTPRQQRQSHRPSRAVALPNAFGTAPGLHTRCTIELSGTQSDIFCLPGPPGELHPMFLSHVLPALRPPPDRAVLTRLLHIVGIAEADCVEMLGDLTKRTSTPLVGITASAGILTLRIRDHGEPHGAARRVDDIESQVRSLLTDHALPFTPSAPTTGPENLAFHLLNTLRNRAHSPRSLAVVESCTGGMVGQLLTSIPGASTAFRGGYITYSNSLKESLGVDPITLAQHGSVSPQTAREMAQAGLLQSGADLALAITGIAGPDGSTPTKPVGTVHIAMAWQTPNRAQPPQVHSRHFLFSGDREDIRRRATITALAMAHFLLARAHPNAPRLLWEMP